MKKLGELFGLFIAAMAIIGWVLNFVAFANLDFKSPYKAEVFRGAGVLSPLGCFLGFIIIND